MLDSGPCWIQDKARVLERVDKVSSTYARPHGTRSCSNLEVQNPALTILSIDTPERPL